MEQRLECCLHCGITLYIQISLLSPESRLPPHFRPLVHIEKLNKVLQVTGSSWHPFSGIKDWPRFFWSVTIGLKYHIPRERQEHLSQRYSGKEQALRVDVGYPGRKCPECPRWLVAADHLPGLRLWFADM